MNAAEERIADEAAAWHLASMRDDMDWDGFTLWLEASPAHRVVYEEMALADAALENQKTAFASTEALAEDRRSRRWPVWLGGAMAASLAAILLVPQFTAPAPQTFVTAGAARSVALGDGSQIMLAPHSRLRLGGRHEDQIALEGAALFAIRHDPQRALSISAGGLQIGDIGTRFEVQTNGSAVRVAVSEGRVQLRGDVLGRPIDLTAGRRILFDPAHNLATVTPVSPQAVGEWRQGRLTYDAAPLSLVAADLARYASVSVAVPRPLADRRFSGTLSIQDGDTAVRDLAQLMGLELSGGRGSYRLGEAR